MTAMITGASRGLGRATALELAAHGWDLALVARGRDDLEAVATEARAFGVRAEAFPASVEDESSVADLFSRFQASFERLDALVNCAGTGSFAPTAEANPDEWTRILAVNLTGTFLCSQAAVWLMTGQGSGHILNVLSIAAKVALPGAGAYCASKWGALGFTKVLAEEVRRQGIKVTALCPGSVNTPFWDNLTHNLNRDDMLPPGDVAATIRYILEQPPTVHTDEVVLMPPKGIL